MLSVTCMFCLFVSCFRVCFVQPVAHKLPNVICMEPLVMSSSKALYHHNLI